MKLCEICGNIEFMPEDEFICERCRHDIKRENRRLGIDNNEN